MPDIPPPTEIPLIPDHEMLRVIGRGSYGEIWLARSLTGTLRAVKIVYRRTFQTDRAFNREFEGMCAFEPISRAHEGFMDILHVGRNGAFFYYIMELADDHLSGREIDIDRYVPKTLASELKGRGRIPAAECVSLGLSLTEALQALHERGLAHRDIKPANVIFVNGRPKLADIGLVAAAGQRSFVGTEGYIPPEGPGTATADIYSLGKVLYEIAMGKDRMDFPEVSTRLAELPDKDDLLKLNDVLLKACANAVPRRYRSAGEMREDLLRIGGGASPRRSGPLVRWMMIAAALGIAALIARHYWPVAEPAAGTETPGLVVISTNPPGAMVSLGDSMKRSPARFKNVEPGGHSLHIMLLGYDPVDQRILTGGGEALPRPFVLLRSTGSLRIGSDPAGAEWKIAPAQDEKQPGLPELSGATPQTVPNLPTGHYRLTVRHEDWLLNDEIEIKRGEQTVKDLTFASGKLSVSSDPAGADISVDTVPRGKTPLEIELRTGEHRVAAVYKTWPEQDAAVTVEPGRKAAAQFEFATGSVKITTAPRGAVVLQNGKELGKTPLPLDDLPPGEMRFDLRLDGYKPAQAVVTIEPKKQVFSGIDLEKKLSPELGKPWQNSLGIRFAPVGNLLFAVWKTRVKDYDAFCAATGRRRDPPDFAQTENDPVVKVSWADSKDFCAWLTEKEHREGLLDEGQSYRLPADEEWSRAVGLPDEGGGTPESRDGKIKGEFPWGKQWPPPPGAGNYADRALRNAAHGEAIEGYSDGFPQTSPVGSFKPNTLGLCDLGGNAWEWIEEGYNPAGKGKVWGVLRGGSWANGNRIELQSSYRNVVDRNDRDVIYGFRCVLVLETRP